MPVVLILCIVLASLAIGLGVKGLNQVRELQNKQKSIQSFNRLVKAASNTTYGGVNETKKIRLELDGGTIRINNDLAQLEKEEEIIKSEILPLPLLENEKENYNIQSGVFQIKLVDLGDNANLEGGNRLVLELSEL